MTLQTDIRDQLAVSDWNSVAATLTNAVNQGVASALGLLGKLTSTPALTGATRSFGTPFQVDADHPALVSYSLQLSAGAATGDVLVQLLSDASSPPVTEVDRAYLQQQDLISILSINVGVGVAAAPGSVRAFVPAGHYVELTATPTGTGAATLLNAVELVFR